jgi:hypothetical protein
MHALPIQAMINLALHDSFMARHSFEELHIKIRGLPIGSRRPNGPDATSICRAIAHACIWYPKDVLCLQRSSVAVSMLRQRGIHAELVIGVQRLPFRAHAWVEIDGDVANDRLEVKTEFQVMERC